MRIPQREPLLLLSLAYLVADAYLMGSRGAWVRLMVVLAVPRLYLHTRRHLSRRAIYALIPAIAAGYPLRFPSLKPTPNATKENRASVIRIR